MPNKKDSEKEINKNFKKIKKRYLKKGTKVLITSLSIIVIFGGVASGTAYYFLSNQNHKEQSKNEIENNNNTNLNEDNNLIIGSWNALNFINASNQSQITNGKTDAIANIINFLKYDLIGILEINKDGSNNQAQVDYLMKQLNNNQNNKRWAKRFSGNLKQSPNTAPGQVEQVLILYNENLLTFKNSSEYSNPENDGLYYVRPPYGASFSYKTDSEISFGVIFDHFDSPGTANRRNSSNTNKTPSFIPETAEVPSTIAKGQGSYEVHDSWYVTDVLKEMQTKLGTNNLIFMADTNIKLNNQKKAFDEKTLSDNGYLFAFDDSDDYKTSLSTTINNYANPYDKIIYKLSDSFGVGQLKVDEKYMKKVNEKNQAFIFDLWKVLAYQIITKKDKQRSDTSYIRSIVSDHAPVGIPITIK